MLVNANPDDLISISTDCDEWQNLQSELSRPKRIFTDNGKIVVESKKKMRERGVDSPNLADSAVIANAAKKLEIKRQQSIKIPKRIVLDDAIGW